MLIMHDCTSIPSKKVNVITWMKSTHVMVSGSVRPVNLQKYKAKIGTVSLCARAVFKIIAESNYMIATAMLSDCLKNLVPIRSNTKTNCTLQAWFFPCFEEVRCNFLELTALFVPVVIGWSNYTLALVFWQSFQNCSIITTFFTPQGYLLSRVLVN